MLRSLSRFLQQSWYRGAWWLILLRPLEALYRAGCALRRYLYRLGLLSVYRACVPVVVVGNITTGGTGKTPVVIALVEALMETGLRVGVVSRGYGASVGKVPYRVADHSAASDCGDEPLLIYQRTGAPVVVSPSRTNAVKALLATETVDVVISDDGLQHYALARDMEIVMYDAQAGFANGCCLPAGPLREPLSRLRSVDFVLPRGLKDSQAGVSYRIDRLVNVASGDSLAATPESIGASVYAIAGIARPEQFFSELRRLGFSLEEFSLPDHYLFTASDFTSLVDRPIIMTEKDAVKCRPLVGENAWYLQVSASLPNHVIEAVADLGDR